MFSAVVPQYMGMPLWPTKSGLCRRVIFLVPLLDIKVGFHARPPTSKRDPYTGVTYNTNYISIQRSCLSKCNT